MRSRHREHLRELLAVAREMRQTTTIAQGADLLRQVESLEGAAIALFNNALARDDEVAAAAWFDRALKASTFRLSVENAQPRQRKDTPIATAFAKQEALANTANRFIQLLEARKGACVTIEDDTPNAIG